MIPDWALGHSMEGSWARLRHGAVSSVHAMSTNPTVSRYLDATPTDEETARAGVAPCRDLDAASRLQALTALLRGMDALLQGRQPLRSPDDVNFWRHWKDSLVGCPR